MGHELVAKQESDEDRVELALCDREPDHKGCTLSAAKRGVAIRELGLNIGRVATTYGDALQSVQMEKLLEKDEDLGLLASVVLDVTSALLVGAIAKAGAKALQSQFASRVRASFGTLATASGATAEKAGDSLAGKGAEKGVESALSKGKEHLNGPPNTRVVDKKAEATAFISQLYDAAMASYGALQNDFPKVATDNEILNLRDQFKPGPNHSLEHYKQTIRAKLERYEKSGVLTIGRRHAQRDVAGTPLSVDVVRDTRVVWHKYKSGFPTTLVYEHIDGERMTWVVDQAEAKQDRIKDQIRGRGMTFGPRRAIDKEAWTGRYVPDEFTQAAIARHEATWGEKPRIVEIDDTAWNDPLRAAAATAHNTLNAYPKQEEQ